MQYEVRDAQTLGYCHCSRCQRLTGSSLAGVVVAKEHFRLIKGETLVKRYESELAPRTFCSNCGSSLYDDLGAVYFVAAGLMQDLDLRPSFHQQVAYKASRHEIGDDAPQYADMTTRLRLGRAIGGTAHVHVPRFPGARFRATRWFRAIHGPVVTMWTSSTKGCACGR